mgnify:CR=1 FL=1
MQHSSHSLTALLRILVLALALTPAFGSRAAGVDDGGYTTLRPTFTWGAAAGASIDLTTNDMSTVDFEISFGMRRGWINFLGVGVEADIMVSNSCRSFPLFAELRTNFVDRPTVAFADIKVGASLNYLEHNHQQTGVYTFAGAGFNLARSSKFSSHLIIGYTFRQRRTVVGEEMTHHFRDLHYATVKIGVSF